MEQPFTTPDFDSSPLVLGVSGLPGAGRATMAAALRERFGDAATVDADAASPDLLVRVIGASLRDRDRAMIAASTSPVLVVVGKADTRADPRRLADAAAAALGRPVFPVSGLLAAVVLGVDETELLRRWQRAGVRVPRAAAEFAGDDPTGRDRARMMSRLGRRGLVAAFAGLAARPDATAAELTEMLHAGSGIDALAAPIAGAFGQIAQDRRVRRLIGLRLLAARGLDRVTVEHRLVAESLR